MPKKTFKQFCDFLRGYKIINKKGETVPKFIVYWENIQPVTLLRKKHDKYKLIQRR